MTMPLALASAEMTTGERCEYLLTVMACAMTHKRPHELLPWVRAGLQEFAEGFRHG